MAEATVGQLVEVLGGTGDLIDGVRPDQWATATPCTGWTSRDLVNHLLAGDRLFTIILRGGDPAEAIAEVRGQIGVDQLGAEPAAAFRRGAGELVAAFSEPGALARMVTVPAGTVPGIVALHLRLVEDLVHGWDLARATGQQTRFSEDLVEQELAFTASMLALLPDPAPGRRPFAPAQSAPAGAPAIDRLAAALGRSVTASPSSRSADT